MSTEYDIETGWEPYQRFMGTPQLAGLLERPVKVLGEAPEGIIPSIILAPDGPKLSAVYLVTRSLLSEIRPDGVSFDVVDRRRVHVMRWFFGDTHFQSQPDAPVILYKTATLQLNHGMTMTHLNFVGEDSEAWVAEVCRLVPSGLVTSGIG